MADDVSREPAKADVAEGGPVDLFNALRNADKYEEPVREADAQFNKADAGGEQAPQPADTETTEGTAEEKFKFAGKEYTAKELQTEFGKPETILDLLTAREQYRNLNRKHEETVSALKAYEGRGNVAQEVAQAIRQTVPQVIPQAPAAQPDLGEIKRLLKADAEGWVARGIIDKDTYEAVPDLVHMLIFQARERALFERQINEVYEREIRPRMEFADQARSGGVQQVVLNRVEQLLNATGSRGGIYESIKDPQIRAGFVEYLSNVNPEAEILFKEGAEEFIASQFVAYNRDNLLKLYEEANKATASKNQETNRALVTGEQSGARHSRGREVNEDIKRVLFARG